MNKNVIFKWVLAIVLASGYISCNRNNPSELAVRILQIDPGFSTYIEEYTSGLIKTVDAIQVRLTTEVAGKLNSDPGNLKKLFSFSPSISGKVSYEDGLVSFHPTEKLDDGKEYNVTFKLKEIADVPKKYQELKFNVFTLKKNFSVLIEGLKTREVNKADQYFIAGEMITSVSFTLEEVEKILKAKQDGKKLPIKWEQGDDENSHRFTIEEVQRGDKASKVELVWDGNPVDLKEKGSKNIEVPGFADFKLMNVSIIQQPEQQLKLLFSDPLDPKQDLEGLVQVKNAASPELTVEGNELTVYLKERLYGKYILQIDQNIRNKRGYSLNSLIEENLDFQLLKPQLRLPGRGVIMPGNGPVIFPFEAVNLKAVNLRIVKIFPSNIIHFLQSNSIKDSYTYNLKQVGKLIYSKRIDLITGEFVNFNKWNAFSIDLSQYIEIEKGAIYSVEIGMQKEYSVYGCTENPDNETPKNYEVNKAVKLEKDYWEDPDNWDSDYYDGFYYNWEERDNPCSRAYFHQDRNIRRNIMVSNIGLTAKKGIRNEILIAATDLQTAQPMDKVQLQLYSYQLQVIGESETNSTGFANMSFTEKPFLLVASKNGQKSYLKLNDSNSLSLSQFDVSGDKIQDGIKAFIYTERGVWRPGDSIYVSVMVEEKLTPLPDKHPVLFKLTNPKGQVVQELVRSLDNKKLVTFRTTTSEDAETGLWKAYVSIGGAEFSKFLRIETVKPNRLKINLTTDSEIIRHDQLFSTARIESAWLTGIKAPNLRTLVELTMKPDKTTFTGFPLFKFDDETKSFQFETKTLIDKKSDENGTVILPLQLGTFEEAPGMLNAEFTVRVFEPGGDASIRQFSKKYSPFEKYAGIFIARENENQSYIKVDESSVVKLVSVNPSGVTVADKIELSVYRLDWRWWWESSEENVGSYISSNNSNLVASKIIELQNGQTNVANIFKYEKWGRYMLVARSSSRHTVSQTVYNKPDFYEDDNNSSLQATMLSFTSDKKKYTVGENIAINFPAPDNGKALVCIENGTSILDKFWINTVAGNNVLNLEAKDFMAPCVYVHISLIQPFGQKNNDRPIRMYGVIPVPVENPASRLYPVVKMADDFRSEQEIALTVSEKSGKAMSYTVAIVDDGLLDLTNFKTPDPWSGIYRKEALGVRTWDLYDDVLGAFGGRIEKLFAIGGDLNQVDPTKNKAKRFKPVVIFAGPFRLEKGQCQKHAFKLPAYSGSLRTMVIAGDKGAYGSVEKTCTVTSPLMLLPVAPRSLSLGEEITIPVSVFAQKETVKDVSVKMGFSEHFSPIGSMEQQLRFTEKGEKTIEFRLKSLEMTGMGKITIEASSGSETAKYVIDIPVRFKELPVSKSAWKLIKPGESYEYSLIPFGLKGSNKSIVTVSGLPSANIDKRMAYLIEYPYGCGEQILSAVFPQLYLAAIQELGDEQKKQVEVNIQSGINKLGSLQKYDGSFGFWPGSVNSDEWLTNYAGHFMFEAELKGFSVPKGMKKTWLEYQGRMASDLKSTYAHHKINQAYRLYTLALANKPMFSAMNRLREDKTMPVAARWFLASAYAEAGRSEAAYELINMYDVNPQENFNTFTYGDQNRDRAMLLLCMLRLNDENNIFQLYKRVAETLNSDTWLSTQTTAFSLIGIAKTIEKMKTDSKGLSYMVKVDNGQEKEIKTSAILSESYRNENLAGSHKIVLKNTSSGTIYANYCIEGVPVAGLSQKVDSKLESTVQFLTLTGTPTDIGSLMQGKDFIAAVKVKNNSMENVTQCALSFQVPSGWEIRNTRLFDFASGIKEDQYDYRDFRDDKVNTYFDLSRGQTKTFVVVLNAAYRGKYYFPNIQVEAMYDKSYLSVIPGKWVEVVKP